MSGRPRTAIGTHGEIKVTRNRCGTYTARTRYRDLDGRLRQVKASARSRTGAASQLRSRLRDRSGYGSGGLLSLASPFQDLCDLWLADLESREITENTKDNYRDDLRLHVFPYFANYTLGEVTTGRVEHFLKAQRTVSWSRAKHARTLLNQLFGFALRHDAMTRNPVEGTSPLAKPKNQVQALSLDQVRAIRAAASSWRTGAGVRGPRPDGQVRDILEVLLGTSMRPGEVLALRPSDITETKLGMTAHVRGTVVYRRGLGHIRQDHPKTEASVRHIPVPEFAAAVIRRRLATMDPAESVLTIFRNRNDKPLTQPNLRRTFREILALANLSDSGISPRWYRRTGATVLARGLGVEVAASYLGHASSAITEGHYIQPDRTVDFGPAQILERSLRPVDPDETLLAQPETDTEEQMLDEIADDTNRSTSDADRAA